MVMGRAKSSDCLNTGTNRPTISKTISDITIYNMKTIHTAPMRKNHRNSISGTRLSRKPIEMNIENAATQNSREITTLPHIGTPLIICHTFQNRYPFPAKYNSGRTSITIFISINMYVKVIQRLDCPNFRHLTTTIPTTKIDIFYKKRKFSANYRKKSLPLVIKFLL